MPGQIAQLIHPADSDTGPSIHTRVALDWPRGMMYCFNRYSICSYRLLFETQTPVFSLVDTSAAANCFGADVDPVTGNLFAQYDQGASNGESVKRFDPNTFAITGTFGTTTGSPSWPGSIWAAESIVCVGCGTVASGGTAQVGYALIKESELSGKVGVIRTDTMQQAGFYQTVVSGSVDSAGFLIRGVSGPAGASVFLTGSNYGASPPAALPIWKIAITPGAETYNNASWPATNPHIVQSTVGNIAATSVDPTWAHVGCNSIGYDAVDGNLLLIVYTNDAVATQSYTIKVNATSGAVMWVAAVPSTVLGVPSLQGYAIDRSILGTITATSYGMLPSDVGTPLAQNLIGGVALSSVLLVNNQQGQSVASDTAGLFLVAVSSYTSTATNAPTAAAGTPGTFASSFALVAGLFPPPPVVVARLALDNVIATAQQTLLSENLVSLRWSDDRGHSWGSPVSQSIGEAGEYRTSLQWQRLSYSRDRVFELSWSVPMRTALQGAWVDVTPASS